MTYTLHHGDCLGVLRALPDCSVDAVVTDPPYGLSFMGKRWDYDVPSVDVWAECLRVLKPGGHLLAFAGTRTQHRMAVRIEDAGFEIRDMIAWVYGSGFPKSLDVSKAIDKAKDYELQSAVRRAAVAAVQESGLKLPGNSLHDWTVGEHAPGDKWWAEFQRWVPELTDEQRARVEGEIVKTVRRTAGWFTARDIFSIRTPATDAARRCAGWGTALKPALEPITVARKPLDGTVAANVQRWGAGALNVDGCRVAAGDDRVEDDGRRVQTPCHPGYQRPGASMFSTGKPVVRGGPSASGGRWPANVIHDGSDEVVGLFPQAGGGVAGPKRLNVSIGGNGTYGGGHSVETLGYGDTGSAARFFYQAAEDDHEWLDRNLRLSHAGTAEPNLCLQEAADAIARTAAVSGLFPEGMLFSAKQGHSTSVTEKELRTLAEIVMQAIPNIAPAFLREWQHTRLSPTGSRASVVATREPTGIITITASHWKSDGSAVPVTFNITPTNSAHGEAGLRFRYCAKASKRDRDEGLEGFEVVRTGGMQATADGSMLTGSGNEHTTSHTNHHPTVKPTDLMRYLCRLVTPPGGVVLDPFMGSGSTGKAAMIEGFNFIGIEREAEYIEIARARIAAVEPSLPLLAPA